VTVGVKPANVVVVSADIVVDMDIGPIGENYQDLLELPYRSRSNAPALEQEEKSMNYTLTNPLAG
jgi:hypothetical protein